MNNAISTRRSTCRLCDSPNLLLALPIKPTPIADNFVDDTKLNIEQPSIPLDLYQCQACGHVQNIDVVNPELLFRDYLFNTSNSAGLIKHFNTYAEDVLNEFPAKPESFVVEIGSNDGTLLGFFKDKSMKVMGVDPATEIAKSATNKGIPTLSEFFTSNIATQIKNQHGKAKFILANNVFAHSDQLADMTDAIKLLLDEQGVFVFEVSYLLDIVDNYLFDTVYHEHLSYHSIEPFQKFFNKHGLHLFNVKRIGTKGGSIRGFVQHLNGPHPENAIISTMINEERRRNLHSIEIFQQYEQSILHKKQMVNDFVNKAIAANKKIACYGASTTVITLMYHFELENKIQYLIDDNPKKQGLYSPGKHLKVVSSSVLYGDHKPDIVLVLAWQYAEPICSKHDAFVKNDGQFVIPLPRLKVISQVEEPQLEK